MSSSGRCIVYHIDRDNQISFINDEWSLFAAENKARDLEAGSMIGQSIIRSIADETSRQLYWMLITRIRRDPKSLRFLFRCDAPDKRRFMRMEMFPLPDQGVGFKSFCVREESRAPVTLLDADADRSEEFVKICSWCKKVEVGNSEWVEVEDAILRLALFKTRTLPQLTHGMCPGCHGHYWRQLVTAGEIPRP